MKQIKNFLLAFVMLASSTAIAQTGPATTTKMNTKIDSLSRALGSSVGTNLKSAGIDEISFTQFMEGLKDAYAGKVTQEELLQAQKIIDAFLSDAQAKKAKEFTKAGDEFLTANAKKPGVKVLPSGLQYRVIMEGTGVKAVDGDQVTTHYTGTFIDGRVFDSSVQRGEPATFGVNQVIKGWTEALKLMPEGSKWELFIPYDLAYGAQDRGSIPAYSTLIFEIELIDVVGK